jgi:hypothetical protein
MPMIVSFGNGPQIAAAAAASAEREHAANMARQREEAVRAIARRDETGLPLMVLMMQARQQLPQPPPLGAVREQRYRAISDEAFKNLQQVYVSVLGAFGNVRITRRVFRDFLVRLFAVFAFDFRDLCLFVEPFCNALSPPYGANRVFNASFHACVCFLPCISPSVCVPSLARTATGIGARPPCARRHVQPPVGGRQLSQRAPHGLDAIRRVGRRARVRVARGED